jgi:hypothetical protein
MLKKFAVIGAMALSLAWAGNASALNVTFDPSGTPGANGDILIDTLDPTVGNSIALNASTHNLPGDQLTVLFQANLGVASKSGVGRFSNGLPYVDDLLGVHIGPYDVTIVAGFNETVQAPMGGATVQSILNPFGPTNFFNIYVNNVQGDNLTGSCFVCGTLALQGVFQFDPRVSNVSDFTVNDFSGTAPLDGFGADNYPAINTLTGQGSFNTAIRVTSVNSNYFPDIQTGTVLTLVLASSQELLNYQTGDPSACFSNDGTTDCNQAGATLASVGAVNLQDGPNSMFQTDASLAFNTAQVPEPATLTLLGIGILAGARRMRKK